MTVSGNAVIFEQNQFVHERQQMTEAAVYNVTNTNIKTQFESLLQKKNILPSL